MISVNSLKSSIETVRLQVESNTNQNILILENLNYLKEAVKGIQEVDENLNESFSNLKEEVISVLRGNQDNAKNISQKFDFAQKIVATMKENVQTSKKKFHKIDSKTTQESMEDNVSS